MRSFEQYDEICKYFAEGKPRDANAKEVQKHLQLYDLRVGEYLTNKFTLWLDFRIIEENALKGTGIRTKSPLTKPPRQNPPDKIPPGQIPLGQNPPRTKSPSTKSPSIFYIY